MSLYHPKKDLRCLDCGKIFRPNTKGCSETGVVRPQCPNCLEEIDIAEAGSSLDDWKSRKYDDENYEEDL